MVYFTNSALEERYLFLSVISLSPRGKALPYPKISKENVTTMIALDLVRNVTVFVILNKFRVMYFGIFI